MNASYKQISTSDAAKMLRVSSASVSGWCKKGIINFIDVSGPDSTVPRYVLTEEEIDRIKRAIKRWGKQKWTARYNKNKALKSSKSKKVKDDSYIFETPIEVSEPKTEEENYSSNTSSCTSKQDDSEKIANTIMYIQDIKERLEDLEAEKAQLLNELENLKKEVLAYI